MLHNIFTCCKSLFLTGIALLAVIAVQGQTSGVPVEIIHADKMTVGGGDSSKLIILEGNVKLKQGATLFNCNKCIKNDEANTFEAWGNVHINDSDTTHVYSNHLRYLTDKELAYLDGNVKLTDGHTVLTAPSAEYNMSTNIATYKNGGKVVNKQTVITSRAANYYTDIKDVIFMRDVRVNDPGYKIVTDSLLYNTNSQVTRFIAHTVITDSANRKMITKDGYYNLKTGDAEFGQRSIVNDNNKSTIIADSLVLTEEFAQAKGNAVAVDSVRGTIIIADLIYQNRLTEAVLATQNPLMIIKQGEDSIYVTADTLFSAKLTDLYHPVVQKDTLLSSDSTKTNNIVVGDNILSNTSLIEDSVMAKIPQPNIIHTALDSANVQSDSVKAVVNTDGLSVKKEPQKQLVPPKIVAVENRKPITPAGENSTSKNNPLADSTRSALATIKPALKDSAAKNDSTNRYFEAFHNVRIFSDSMQAVSDSLFYSFKDSVFRLYQNPVAWGQDNNQMTGDTLLLHTKHKKPHWFEAIGNGFMISHIEKQAFNQIKSSRIDGYFTDGSLDSMRAKGSAEAIYFLQDDDSAYSGINKSTSDIIDAYLKNKRLNKVVLRGDAKGTIYPIQQKNPKEMQLQGFIWREAERPKTKYDLF
ncbi:MAG: OstA-like protein [Niabella sp.]